MLRYFFFGNSLKNCFALFGNSSEDSFEIVPAISLVILLDIPSEITLGILTVISLEISQPIPERIPPGIGFEIPPTFLRLNFSNFSEIDWFCQLLWQILWKFLWRFFWRFLRNSFRNFTETSFWNPLRYYFKNFNKIFLRNSCFRYQFFRQQLLKVFCNFLNVISRNLLRILQTTLQEFLSQLFSGIPSAVSLENISSVPWEMFLMNF